MHHLIFHLQFSLSSPEITLTRQWTPPKCFYHMLLQVLMSNTEQSQPSTCTKVHSTQWSWKDRGMCFYSLSRLNFVWESWKNSKEIHIIKVLSKMPIMFLHQFSLYTNFHELLEVLDNFSNISKIKLSNVWKMSQHKLSLCKFPKYKYCVRTTENRFQNPRRTLIY